MSKAEQIYIDNYKAGLSVEKIVAKYGCPPGYIKKIRNLVREAGVLRSRGAKRTTTFEDGRKCSKCGEVFPITAQYFYRDKHEVEGYKNKCKKCCGTM
jgi:hypothetical protein